ncbi:MAG: alanine racemase [Deltaproteobacteria bacterium]|nr:alanine racemase [Deltaproteobacteria bacterium]
MCARHRVGSGAALEPEAPPPRASRPTTAAPDEAARHTRAEVNLAHVRHNLRELEACLGSVAAAAHGCTPERTPQIWAVLKADGYGHGGRAIATTLERAGVRGLCVALLEEGIELREAGVRCPILVMGGYYGRQRDGIENLVAHDLTPVVYDAGQIETIASTLRYLRDIGGLAPGRERYRVHLKIDTGMGRLGVPDGELGAVLEALRAEREIELDGLMTHLACADADSLAATEHQLDRFARGCQRVAQAGLRPKLRHAANSAALLRLPHAHLEVVRPGIALFGVHPCEGRSSLVPRAPHLRPVMRVLTEVVALRNLGAGESLGYGHTWRTERPCRIATVPVGYADGLSRALSNRGALLVGGRRAPIVGTVSMDLTMLDVTDIPGVRVRDEVVVLGEQRGPHGTDEITATEVAGLTSSIAWEVLTSISRRVPRFYRHG